MTTPVEDRPSGPSGLSAPLGGRRSLMGDTGYVLLVQFFSRGSLNLLTIFAANVLTVAQFSSYNYFVITATLLSVYMAAGLPIAITKAVSERDRSPRRTADALVSAAALFAGTSAVFLLTAPLYWPLLDAGEIQVSRGAVLLGALCMAFYALTIAGMQGLRAFRQSVAPVCAGAAILAVMAATQWAYPAGQSLLWGVILFNLVPAVLFLRFLRRAALVPRRAASRWPTRATAHHVLASALPMLGSALVFNTVSWLTARTLFEHQRAPTEFGQFVAGMQWYALALFVPLAFAQAIFPRLVERSHGGTLSSKMVLGPAALSFAALVVGGAVAAPFAPVLTWLYGSSYRFSAAFVFTVMLAAAVSGATNLLGQSIVAWRGAGTWFLANLVLLGGSVALLTMRAPRTAQEAMSITLVAQTAMVITAVLIIRQAQRRG